jgi:hypothetical protein
MMALSHSAHHTPRLVAEALQTKAHRSVKEIPHKFNVGELLLRVMFLMCFYGESGVEKLSLQYRAKAAM